MAHLVGDRVRLHGLSSRPELNGKTALVTAHDEERGRCAVDLDGEVLAIKPANLRVALTEEMERATNSLVISNTRMFDADGKTDYAMEVCANPNCPLIIIGTGRSCAREAQRQLKKCAACGGTKYCGAECQAAHWPIHKVSCAAEAVFHKFAKMLLNDPDAKRVVAELATMPFPNGLSEYRLLNFKCASLDVGRRLCVKENFVRGWDEREEWLLGMVVTESLEGVERFVEQSRATPGNAMWELVLDNTRMIRPGQTASVVITAPASGGGIHLKPFTVPLW